MGSIYLSLVLAITLLSTARTSFAGTQYLVGDDNGWNNNGYDYQAWADSKQFYVGDSLDFQYTQGEHNVFELDEHAFGACIIPPLNRAWTKGYDVIVLEFAGGRWFACGVDQHCADDNQKFHINVQ